MSLYSDLKQSLEQAIEIEEKGKPMKALNNQVAGSHYKFLKIQPVVATMAGGLSFCEGNLLKYLVRDKGKREEDLSKAYHYIELQQDLERVYDINYPRMTDEGIHLLDTFTSQFVNGATYNMILNHMVNKRYSKAKELLTKFIRYGNWKEV